MSSLGIIEMSLKWTLPVQSSQMTEGDCVMESSVRTDCKEDWPHRLSNA